MKINVYIFTLKAHPNENHRKYYPWNIADICILIGDSDKETAFKRAMDKLHQENWIKISDVRKDILIEEKIIQSTTELFEQYLKAKNGESILLVQTDNWIGFKDSPPMLIPKITEKFMDKVIIRAGGKRLEYESKEMLKNADYIIDNYIFELKILEEERLFNESVRIKLADLLKDQSKKNIEINHKNISKEKYNLYINIFRKPIQDAIKSASKQIKSTKNILNDHTLKGGIIFLNNGTTSTPPEIFNECINRSITNNTSQIQSHISICNWLETNGYDSIYMYEKAPEAMDCIQQRIADAFDKEMDDFMNHWGRSGFPQSEEMLDPLRNISYEKYGITFTRYGSY